MNLEEFFNMEEKDIIDYDFSSEIIKNSKDVSENHLNLKKEYLDPSTDVMRKYILYKTVFSNCDPDTNEGLLKDIYIKIWELDETKLFSDTMTSAQNIIADFYTNICTSEWQKYKDCRNKNVKNKIQYFSKNTMEDLYKNKELYKEFTHYFIDKNDDSKIILDFLAHYHSLGNYIPVPQGFNCARSGRAASHDMWDITLMKIKQYYDNLDNAKLLLTKSDENLLELLHFDMTFYSTKQWLDNFGTFRDFIDKNYLQSYVEVNNINGEYDIKSCFMKTHSFDNPKILQDKEAYLDYIKEITNSIKQRTKAIKDKYKNK